MKKITFSRDSGIFIDDSIRKMLNLASETAGSVNRLASIVGVSQPSVNYWIGKNKRKSDFIAWDQWILLRRHLAALRLLDDRDIRWLTPSELREEVSRLRASVPVTEEEERALSLFRSLNDDGRRFAMADLAKYAAARSTSSTSSAYSPSYSPINPPRVAGTQMLMNETQEEVEREAGKVWQRVAINGKHPHISTIHKGSDDKDS